MSSWSLSAEFFAFIVLVILLLSFFERSNLSVHRKNFLIICVLFPLFYIIINFIAIRLEYLEAPLWLQLLLISLSYFLGPLLACIQVLYLMQQLLLYVYDKSCMRWALRFTAAIMGVHLFLVLWNLQSGILFYFDEAKVYHYGPLYHIGYPFVLLEILLLLGCFFRHRHSINPTTAKIMFILPIIVVLVMVFQYLRPQFLISGALAACTSLILFIGLQSHRADLDCLAEIGNRNSLFTELSLRMAGKQQFQLVLVSIRQFSNVNQRFGHGGGDAFLREIARGLDTLIPSGKAFRFGNVKFAVLLPFHGQREAMENLSLIRARFLQPWSSGGAETLLYAHFADLVYTVQDWEPTQVFEYLEYALTLIKNGTSDTARFDEHTAAMLKKRKALIWILRRSIRERRFRVFYQPVYSCETGRFSSAEALLRLEDYQGNPISPSEFIPLAEETGLIDELSWIVLDEVCRFLSEGCAVGLEAVSINLSMQQFKDPSLISRIEESLHRYELAPSRLKLEITERVLLQDLDHMRNMMDALTARGLHFYLDDFGTGYSNLSSVLALPFECIKLDQSLLVQFPEDGRANLLVSTLVSLFHDMGQQVVAEGVETPKQAEILKLYRADWLQGYYCARPMPENALISFLSDHAVDSEDGMVDHEPLGSR